MGGCCFYGCFFFRSWVFDSTGYYQEQDVDGTRFLAMPESSWEKFAELIVRECALTLYKSAVQDKRAGFSHEADIMELAGDMIKQHFGVEE